MGTRAVYVRTSTRRQDGAAQRHELTTWLVARGAGDVEWFADLDESGAKAVRPELERLKREVRAGRVREVYASALDRLGRSLVDVVLLLDELTAAGCVVETMREGRLDPGTPTGRFLAQTFANLAEMERGIIRERVRAGVARARAEGTRSGRAIGRPRREVDAAEVARRRASGESWRSIAQALRVPTATIRRAVSKPSPAEPAAGGA